MRAQERRAEDEVLAECIKQHNTPFFDDLVDVNGLLRSQVEDALAELVALGLSPPTASADCARCWCHPLNLIGILMPGPKVPALAAFRRPCWLRATFSSRKPRRREVNDVIGR